jgi:hypothetical protein
MFGLCRYFVRIYCDLVLQSVDTMSVKRSLYVSFYTSLPTGIHTMGSFGSFPVSNPQRHVQAAAKQHRRHRKETTWWTVTIDLTI